MRITNHTFWICFGSLTLKSFSLYPQFLDVTDASGLNYNQRSSEPPFILEQPYMAGGAATADFDNDGWPDLYVTRYDSTDILFRNLGNGTFLDVTSDAGITLDEATNGAAWGDIDNDGDQDLYVTSHFTGRYHLFVNDGQGRFSEEAIERGAALNTDETHYGFSACFGDYNRDGWIDLHTTEWATHSFSGFNHARLLRNLGTHSPGFFSDATVEAGVELGNARTVRAFASRFSDLDLDGWPDLAIAADFGQSQLYWNNQDGTFTNGTSSAGVGTDENGMGIAIGDYDSDGFLDWFVTSIYEDPNDCQDCAWGVSGNRLYRNLGSRAFEDVTSKAGVRDGAWGWAALFFDYDNDADLDLAMTNGIDFGAFNPFAKSHVNDSLRLWRNDNGQFTDQAAVLGIDHAAPGKGLLTFDYDRDGDLDLFETISAEKPKLFRNDLNSQNHWLRIAPIGRLSNRDAIGLRIQVQSSPSGLTQTTEISGGSHFLTQSQRVAHFGLGPDSTSIDSIEFLWPSGARQTLRNIPVDQEISIVEKQTYDSWKRRAFPRSSPPRVSDPFQDADDDGLENVLEYAFGRSPLNEDRQRILQAKPVSADNQAPLLQITFDRRIPPVDLNYAVELSHDLRIWRPLADGEIARIENIRSQDPLMERVAITIAPEATDSRPFFTRLQIQRDL